MKKEIIKEEYKQFDVDVEFSDEKLKEKYKKDVETLFDQVVTEDITVSKKQLRQRKKQTLKDVDNTLHIYLRVSTKGQLDNYSISIQKENGLLLKKKYDFKKVVIHNEGGKSSNYEDIISRQKLFDLICLLDKGLVKHLYVFDLSRLSRNTSVSMYIKLKLIKHRVILYTKDGRYDFDSEEDKLMYGILSLFSEFDNGMRKKRMMLGKVRSLSEGKNGGGSINFGYKLDNEGYIVENQEESMFVREMFNMYDKGKSTNDIRDMFQRHGIKSKWGNDIWNLGTIQKMLQNEIYIGRQVKTMGGRKFILDTKRLVSDEVFRRCNERMISTRIRKNQINKTEQFYLLRNYLFCKKCKNIICGRKVNRKLKRGENYYYCSQSGYRWKEGTKDKTHNCKMNKSLNIEKTDFVVWETICDVFENSKYMRDVFKTKTLNMKLKERDDLDKEIRKLKNKVKKIDRDINKINENLLVIDTKYYSRQMTKKHRDGLFTNLTKEVDKLEEVKSEIENDINQNIGERTWVNWIQKYKNKVNNMRKWKDEKKKRETLESVLHKIDVDYDTSKKKHTLDVHLKMDLFDDKLIYKDKNNKKKGSYIRGGKRTKSVDIGRSKDVGLYIKKKVMNT